MVHGPVVAEFQTKRLEETPQTGFGNQAGLEIDDGEFVEKLRGLVGSQGFELPGSTAPEASGARSSSPKRPSTLCLAAVAPRPATYRSCSPNRTAHGKPAPSVYQSE
jgi:hypothetical protein